MFIAKAIMGPIDWLFPVEYDQNQQSYLYAARVVGAIETIAIAFFVICGSVTLSAASPFLVSSILIFAGGMTNRPNVVHLGIAIAVLQLVPDGVFVSIYDLPQIIGL